MKAVAKFEKVSYEQFKKDFIGCNCIPLKKCIRNDKKEVTLTDIYSEEELDNLIKDIYIITLNYLKEPQLEVLDMISLHQ